MKVLFVINAIPKGGRERRMLELIKGLKKNSTEFDIYLVSLSPVVEYDYVHTLPIRFEIVEKKEGKDLGLISRLRNIIKAFDPDIIHCWDITANGYLSVANFFINKVLVSDVVADAPEHLHFYSRDYLKTKLFSLFSSRIIGNSQAGLRAYGISARRSQCVYNGIDLGRFNDLKPPATVAAEFWEEGKGNRFIVMMVAAFEERKDFETLIEAALALCPDNKNLIFFLVGDGVLRQVLMQKIPAALKEQILFLGKRNDIESLLQIIDVGALITNSAVHGEGISNSIVEYMASGKPVIATTGGGTNEIVFPEENGFLVDRKNPNQIIAYLNTLTANRALGDAMGANGAKLVNERFNIYKMTASYINLYQRLSGK